MLLLLAKLLGRILAHTPEPLLRAGAWGLGKVCYHGYRSRQRSMLHSLACSFPERPESWRRTVACTSCIRMMETVLLSLAAPYLSVARIRSMAGVTEAVKEVFRRHAASPHPLVLGTAHFAYWEGLTWVPLFLDVPKLPEVVTIFRPLRNPAMDEWLRRTRERFGVQLLSRRSGLHASLHVLQRNGVVTLLFDQSAGAHGYLTEFLGRECSTTPLPGLLVEKTGAELAFIFTKRTGFWRFIVDARPIQPRGPSAQDAILALNSALEDSLRTDPALCESWLWLHQRWKILERPEDRRKIEAKHGGVIR